MAEVTAMRNNALPYPIYGAPFVIVFPFLDADGDPTASVSTGLDAEISKNGDTFADCSNETTEIGRGMYYLSLTGTELTCDVAAINAQTSASGIKNTVATLYPRKLVTIASGTAASAGSLTSTIVLDSGASSVDDFYNGMVCIATIDGNVEVRVITDYTGSTKSAAVTPDWNVAPDSDDTFVIKLPEGPQMHQANTTLIAGATVSTSTAQIGVNAVQAGGTAWGSGAITAGSIASDAITAAKIATGAIDADALAADAVDEIIDEVIEGSTTLRQMLRLMASALLGKVSGAAGTSVAFRDLADSKNRIAATVDSNGNRTAVTLDAS